MDGFARSRYDRAMKITAIALDEIMISADGSRFMLNFSVEYDAGEPEPYSSSVTVGIDFDDDRTHSEIVARGLHKLAGFFRAAGNLTRDEVAELYVQTRRDLKA